MDLFDLHPKEKEVKVEEDEVFGTEVIELKPFDSANITEIYHISNYPYKQLLLN